MCVCAVMVLGVCVYHSMLPLHTHTHTTEQPLCRARRGSLDSLLCVCVCVCVHMELTVPSVAGGMGWGAGGEVDR